MGVLREESARKPARNGVKESIRSLIPELHWHRHDAWTLASLVYGTVVLILGQSGRLAELIIPLPAGASEERLSDSYRYSIHIFTLGAAIF